MKNKLFMTMAILSSTQLWAQPEEILNCRQQVDHGLTLTLYRNANRYYGALHLTTFATTKEVARLTVCNSARNTRNGAGEFLRCNNTEWDSRWNVVFNAAQSHPHFSATVIHNEKVRAKLLCSKPPVVVSEKLSENLINLMEGNKISPFVSNQYRTTYSLSKIQCAYSEGFIWANCDIFNDKTKSVQSILAANADSFFRTLQAAGVVRSKQGITVRALKCSRTGTRSQCVVYP